MQNDDDKNLYWPIPWPIWGIIIGMPLVMGAVLYGILTIISKFF